MRRVLFVLICLISIPVFAIDFDTGGCYLLPTDRLSLDSLWEAITAHPESIGDNTGFWTLDATAGNEFLLVTLSLGQSYAVRSVRAYYEVTGSNVNDTLEIRLDNTAVETFVPTGVGTASWSGNTNAESVQIYLRADTLSGFRGILHDVDVCTTHAPNIDPAQMFNQMNQVMPAIFTILAIGGGISIAVLISKFIINMMVGAFK